jgi:hypothetical protein
MAIDQTKLNPELCRWLESRQSSLKIVKTTTTPSGQILDWIRVEDQVASGEIASPPPPSFVSMPARLVDPKRPVKAVTFELDDPKVERGPAGTVPIVRPDLSRLTKTIALKDYLSKRGGAVVNKRRRNQTPADPNPFHYFHGTDSEYVTAYGCDFIMNVWDPSINDPSVAGGDDHSILQTWLQNYDRGTHSLEGGWTVDQNLNGDTQPHIFTYYTTNSYSQDGNNLGGYNRTVTGWVQYSNSVFPGSLINGISVFDGEQFDVSMKFQLYKEPTNGQLNWWVSVQGIWMGYYPASLYDGGLATSAEWIAFGGEVFSSLSDPSLTQDQMGSGWQAEGGWTHAAYLRNLRNQSDLDGTMIDNGGGASSDTGTGSGASPYDIVEFMNSGTSWGSYLYVGGPSRYPAKRWHSPIVPGLVALIFGGIAVDGGGVEIVGGVPHPVPPWGELVADIGPGTLDMLIGILLDEIAKSISDRKQAAATRKAILSGIGRAVATIARGVSE